MRWPRLSDREGRLPLVVALALGLLAFRPLFLAHWGLPGQLDVARWILVPDETTPLLVIGIAAWLLWRRRSRLLALPDRRDRAITAALLAVAAALFVWAQLTRTGELLIPSLSASLLALGGSARGRAGCRVVLLPALVLLLAVPIPAPILDELVWQLQLSTAWGTAWLMDCLGYDVVLQGVLIRNAGEPFIVVESCSGLRGIEILTLLAIVTRELFASHGARQWLVLCSAPLLGFALNIVRVFLVVTSGDPEVVKDHTLHGVAVLVAGAGILYALAWAMAGFGGPSSETAVEARPEPGAHGLCWRGAALWLLALGILSLVVPPFPSALDRGLPRIDLPERHLGWVGEDVTGDRLFTGLLLRGPNLSRRYEKARENGPSRVVELFVGLEIAGDGPSGRLFTSRLRMPAGDWSFREAEHSRVWALGIDAELHLASRGAEHILVYTWRVRDQGIWLEAARDALALEQSPLRRDPPRAVVRLATPLANDGRWARERGKQTLDRFIRDYRSVLAEL